MTIIPLISLESVFFLTGGRSFGFAAALRAAADCPDFFTGFFPLAAGFAARLFCGGALLFRALSFPFVFCATLSHPFYFLPCRPVKRDDVAETLFSVIFDYTINQITKILQFAFIFLFSLLLPL